MSDLSNISITHTFNGDTAASNLVNAADLDTQLGNLAAHDNDIVSALDTITDGDNNLAAQTVGIAQLKPEVIALIDTGGQTESSVAFTDVEQTFTALQTFEDGITVSPGGTVTLPNASINDAALSANVTLQGNVFNDASKLVQLTSDNKYPVIDGSLITNLVVDHESLTGLLGGASNDHYHMTAVEYARFQSILVSIIVYGATMIFFASGGAEGYQGTSSTIVSTTSIICPSYTIT